MREPRIYLDHSATTPLHSEVLDAMMPYLTDQFGNPGSLHQEGRKARKAIERAREEVAAFINAEPREIIFTGSGTEANNLIVRQPLRTEEDSGQVICSAFEHHSVLGAIQGPLPKRPSTEWFLPVSSEGMINRDAVTSALEKKPALISIMLANNEIGTIQPIASIAQECRSRGVWIHSDAVQAAGKIRINVKELQVDALTLSAHKIHGPKGIAVCYVRHGVPIHSLIQGGAQESRRRAGTENVAGIVGFAHACKIAQTVTSDEWARIEQLRNRLESSLLSLIPHSWVNGAGCPRLPHITNIAFKGLEGERIMMALDAVGISVGTGSACSSGSLDPSHVLLAMGQTHSQAHAAIRISLSHMSTEQEIDAVVEKMPPLIARLRRE